MFKGRHGVGIGGDSIFDGFEKAFAMFGLVGVDSGILVLVSAAVPVLAGWSVSGVCVHWTGRGMLNMMREWSSRRLVWDHRLRFCRR